MSTEVNVTGGSEKDRQDVLALHQKYLEANAVLDWETLRDSLWCSDEDAIYFNLNGHTYVGRSQWVRLWQYYLTQTQIGDWIPYDIAGLVSPDLAVIWCHRKCQFKWVGNDPRPDQGMHADKEFISRSTMVFKKENGQWRVGHVHFSPATTEIRPGGI